MDAFYICQVPFPLGPTFILGRNHAFHEPSEAPTGFGLRQSSGALAMEASQPKAPEDWRSPRRYRAIRRFMDPMHAKKRKGAFHEPTNRSLLWESGAEDARTPDASRPPGVSEPREASGVRPIYRRFSSGAGRPAVHGRNARFRIRRGV